jgi:hypothetical protein
VAFELARTEQAQSLTADRDLTLRNSIESQIVEITGIDPSLFGGLRTDSDRVAYTNGKSEFIAKMMALAQGSAG